jgi:NADPH:quinone reductase-like Zn-dependent oxidoreductase
MTERAAFWQSAAVASTGGSLPLLAEMGAPVADANRRLVYGAPGPRSVLRLEAGAPGDAARLRAGLQRGQVLVRVLAASLNPVDWKLRVQAIPLLPLPKGVGCDLCGVVEASGGAGSRFKAGDRVMCLLPLTEQPGALSDLVVVRESHLALAPASLSDEECASLPLVALTVLQSFAKAGVVPGSSSRRGQRVLVHAGAGGVGSIAVQVAKSCGLFVFTTCSAGNVALCKSLGADVVIDYNAQRFEDVATGLDIVFDVMGGDYELRSMRCIKSDGYYLSIMNSGWATKVATGKTDGVSGADSTLGSMVGFAYAAYRQAAQYVVGPWYRFCVVKPDGRSLALLAELCQAGAVRPVIDGVWPLSQYDQAFARLETGHARGKVVVRVADPAARL